MFFTLQINILNRLLLKRRCKIELTSFTNELILSNYFKPTQSPDLGKLLFNLKIELYYLFNEKKEQFNLI